MDPAWSGIGGWVWGVLCQLWCRVVLVMCAARPSTYCIWIVIILMRDSVIMFKIVYLLTIRIKMKWISEKLTWEARKGISRKIIPIQISPVKLVFLYYMHAQQTTTSTMQLIQNIYMLYWYLSSDPCFIAMSNVLGMSFWGIILDVVLCFKTKASHTVSRL